jgi:hypothetical protein
VGVDYLQQLRTVGSCGLPDEAEDGDNCGLRVVLNTAHRFPGAAENARQLWIT